MQIAKSTLLFLLILFTYTVSNSQTSTSNIIDTVKQKRKAVRNVLWLTPTRAHQINGIAIGTIPSSIGYDNDSLTINGMHIETNPIMLMLLPYVIASVINGPSKKQNDKKSLNASPPDSLQYARPNKVNGINISLLGSAEMYYLKGISISGLATLGQQMHGISITSFQNRFYSFKGVMIAALLNDATKGTGLQIGLFNRCLDCKGVQIGLWNRMGKRTLPFFNIRL